MKTLFKAACILALLAAGACAPAGYYDSNGVYHAYGKSDSFRKDNAMACTPYDDRGDYSEPNTVVVPSAVSIYTRPGYYDYNGYYIPASSGPQVPEDYFPPRGLCRMWFTDRPASQQPPVESCAGIRNHLPVGAYVIYGG